MGQEEKEDWIEDVFDSVRQTKNVEVPEGLFEKIEQEIDKTNVLPFNNFRTYLLAAGIAALLFANGSILYRLSEGARGNPSKELSESVYVQSMTLDFNFYDI
ncbi:MAG: hypothetical protein MRZ79_21605 [Bacteroidia bacterium]|nr:hypothetical protein [Bacteroidia bacterium]